MVIRRDPERLKMLRAAIRYLLREDALQRGHQARLAEHFSVSRQRVHQVVNEEELRRDEAAATRLHRAALSPQPRRTIVQRTPTDATLDSPPVSL